MNTGDDDAAILSSELDAASLSDAQKNYESFALTSNGELHYVNGSL
jgi:hypothetical protein